MDSQNLRYSIEEIKPIFLKLLKEARELERLHIATWLLGRVPVLARKGEVQAALAVNMVAQMINANAIELNEGGDC